jgi:hypothetical protein
MSRSPQAMSRKAFHTYAAVRAEAEGSLPPGDPRALAYLESIGQARLPGLERAHEPRDTQKGARAEESQGDLFQSCAAWDAK